MHRARTLIDLDRRILRELARVRFATREQLALWNAVHPASVSRRLHKLLGWKLVRVERSDVPAIWSLTISGAAALGVSRPRRHGASWSVMSHACHANEAELALGQRHAGFHLLDRLALLKHGFNPAHGEHAGVDVTQASFFVLLDDYAMQSDRIEHAWTRRHVPHLAHFSDPTGKAWREAVHHFYVVTTDAGRAKSHQAYLYERGLPAEVLSVKALWRE